MRTVSGHKKAGFWAVAAMTLGLCAAGAHAQTAPQTANTAISIMQASAALQAGKCADAEPALAKLWDDANLQASDPDMAEQFRFQRVVCTLQTGDIKTALLLSEQNIHHAGASISSLDLNIFLLLSDNRTQDAAAALEDAVARFPAEAPQLTDMSVMGTLLSLHGENTERLHAVMARLEKAHWQIHDPSTRLVIDFLRLGALRAAVAANDKSLADLYRADIAGDAYIYMIVQGDGKLTDASVPSLPITPVIRKQIDDVKTYVSQNPTDLSALDYLVTMESSNDEHQTALIQLNGILALVNQYGLDQFQQPTTYPGLIASKAELLADTGKPDDALDVYKDGMARMSGAGAYPFYVAYINYMIETGNERSALTLETKLDFSAMSPDQKREVAALEACAYAYMKDTVRYTQTLAAATGPNGVPPVRPYLCAGDVDGAAKALVGLINDPNSRDSAIGTLQATLPSVAHSPRDAAYVAAYDALRTHPSVVAAAGAQNIVIRNWQLRF